MQFTSLFIGRSDVHAAARSTGDYAPVHSPLTSKILRMHVQGKKSVGIYLIRPADQTVRLLALDIDRDDQALAGTVAQSLIRDVPDDCILIERTGGRGWHVWVFFDDWVPARHARAIARSALRRVELDYPVEIYPKQEETRRGGLGNLIRLPLGKHPKTGEEGQLFNAFMLPINTGDSLDPELPILSMPAPEAVKVASSLLESEARDQDKRERPNGTIHKLPCIDKFQRGISEGYRDEAMFRLAAYFHRQQVPKEAAFIILSTANGKNKPPLSTSDINDKLESAYKGAGYGLPCSSSLVGLDSPFCDNSCPVYPTAKARSPSGTAASAGAFPRVVERLGTLVFQQRFKDGIRDTVLSNFSIQAISRLEMVDAVSDDVLRVCLKSGEREDVVDLPVSAFAGRANFIRALTRAEYAWYGTDQHCQYLKAYLMAQDVPTQKAVSRLGRFQEIWVARDGILPDQGADQTITYCQPAHFGTVQVSIRHDSFSPRKAAQVLRGLIDANNPSVMVPVLGWLFAVPHKLWLFHSMGHFPLLMLYGTRGAGKTQLAQRIILPLFGYSSRESQVHFCDTTRFVLVSYGAATTTVPLFFDEYRPNALGSVKLRQLWDHWRHVYAGDVDHRGQADLTRLDFRQTSPVIVAGEELVTDPAMQERMIQVGLSPDNLTPVIRRTFANLPPLEMASRFFIQESLSLDPHEVWDAAKALLPSVWSSKVSPRVYDNLLVTAFGIESWARLSGARMQRDLARYIFDTSTMVRISDEDIRTPLWVDDFLLDVASLVDERGPFSWGIMRKEESHSIMYFNLRRAHAEWAKDMRARGEYAVGLEPIRRQLSEHSSSSFVLDRNTQFRIPGTGNVRVYKVDVDAMREALEK